MERFRLVRCVGGFRTVPADPANAPLLTELWGGNPTNIGALLPGPEDMRGNYHVLICLTAGMRKLNIYYDEHQDHFEIRPPTTKKGRR